MSTTLYYKNIQRRLFLYADIVEHSNSLGLSDETIHAEEFFSRLLNDIYNWKLVNANSLKKNQDSFDLIDKRRKLYVQVTSSKSHSAKYKKTLDSFKRAKKKNGCSRLIIFFITRKCSASLLEPQKHTGFTSEAYDIPKLLTHLKHQALSTTQLKDLNLIIQDYLRPVDITGSGENTSAEIIRQQAVRPRPKGILIKRDKLITELASYVQAENGLIVGGPGGGKTHSLEELQRHCITNKIPCFILRINELTAGTDEDINRFFGLKTNWLTAFKNTPLPENINGILIFDAFDTAKDEQLRSFILTSLKRAINELKPRWNIIVSSRSFEAAKSTRLMELFPQIRANNSVYCRYKEIPLLSHEEVQTSVKKYTRINSLYQKCTGDLKEILRTPYFLKLFERIIAYNRDLKVSDISHIETAEQLLSKFWNKHVVNDSQNDLLLRQLTQLLVTKENLSVRKDEIVNESNVRIVDHLLGEGILMEGSPTKQKILFAHNILLEYAVSIYLIPYEATEIVAFIKANQKLPFHFRQSFIYFYNQLWQKETALFWKHYQATRTENAPIFRLFHQTILNYVVVTGFRNSDDLSHIWSLSDTTERATVLRKVLEGIRFLKKETFNEKDVKFFADVSENMHELFLWELGFLLNKAFQDQTKYRNPKLKAHLSKATFNYIKFVMEARKLSPNKYLVERNGGNWGVTNLCYAFEYDKKTASKYVFQIIDMLQEPGFPIHFFWILIDNVSKIIAYDKDTAFSLIRACYYHVENSNEETIMGTGVVMNLRSNRGQDFESTHHKIESDFSELLESAPLHAIPFAIEIANKLGPGSWRSTWQGESFVVKVAGVQSKVTQDYNIEPFDEDDKKYGPGAPIARLFEKLSKDASDQKLISSTRTNIKLVIKCAEKAAVWKRIIDLFIEFPKHFLVESLSLLMNQPFLIIEETTYEAGKLITAIWPFLSKTQRGSLEKQIWSLKVWPAEEDRMDFIDNRIRRFLSCIPNDDLKDAKSGELLKQLGKKENKPLRNVPRLMPHNADKKERMIRAGLDPESSVDLNLYDQINKLEAYNRLLDKDSNVKPNKTDYLPLFDLAVRLFDTCVVPGIPNSHTKDYCDDQISSFLRHLAKLGKKLPKKVRLHIERISVWYINDIYYFSPAYDIGEPNTRSSAFTPTARTNSVGTLSMFLNGKSDAELLNVLRPLIADNTKIIRFKVMRVATYFWHNNRPDFWACVKPRYSREYDGLVMSELLRSISYTNIIEDDLANAEKGAEMILEQLKSIEGKVDDELWRFYSLLLVRLLFYFNSEVALKLFTENLSIKPLTKTLILHLFSIVDPFSKDNNYTLNPGLHQKEFNLLRDILTYQFKAVQEKGISDEGVRDNFNILDYFIQQFNFTILDGKKPNTGQQISKQNQAAFFKAMKPLLNFFVEESNKIGTGFMVAHTGYYFMQVLNKMIAADPEYVLSVAALVVKLSSENGFTYDNTTLAEIVKLTETIMADHKLILQNQESFDHLITILDLFANSGWQEAIELTWKLKDIF